EAGGGLARPKLAAAEAWAPLQELAEERAALGFYLSGHPLDDYADALAALNVTPVSAVRPADGGGVTLAAVVRGVRHRRSKSGKPFAWVEASDPTGEFEVTVFSEALEAARAHLEPGALVLIAASVDERDGEARFTAEAVRALDAAAARRRGRLCVRVASPEALASVKRRLAGLDAVDARNAGDVFAALTLGDAGREVDIDLGVKAALTPAVRGALKTVEGVSDVEFLV
ncbi:MAG: OB-fold nucleic acid binding domain-containing protein, partial [Pseudomonadota bacterium]